ncbi:hypothetical protein LGT39_07950 [Demequina sp. TTPB684]|uniref:hypothetical protein n=1 Tax=unclassified Demequina TaxID=2620311 RepID=UPI001CF18378|nr:MULTISPECIES: hypothetical protein [unclassified Demequina]MCB2412776.1 hypothetical protein [Demequina sp. TTPB684]UPU87123.1 hypothetical protein LGT36_007485 [Demequina sp. TMPB413]
MTESSPQQILEHCRAWSQRAADLQRTARVKGAAPRAQHASPLASICDDIETAGHDTLGAVVAGLTVCLIQRNNEFTGYGSDYRTVWAWCAELLVGAGVGAPASTPRASGTVPADQEWTVGRLFAAAAHAVLALPVSGQVAGVDRNTRALADDHAAITAYLAFPLLEQVLRASCHRHFARGGRIVKPFDTPGQRANRHYYIEGGTCSSIGDLLWLFRHQYAPVQIGADLDAIDARLAAVVPGGSPDFRVLHPWRHDTMDSDIALPVMAAVALNLAIVVALAGRVDDFGDAAAAARDAAARGEGRYYPLEA